MGRIWLILRAFQERLCCHLNLGYLVNIYEKQQLSPFYISPSWNRIKWDCSLVYLGLKSM